MKILILEDNTERIRVFKSVLGEHELFIFDKVKEAKSFIEKNEVEILLLDHDLDDKIMVNSNDENTGYQFAKFIKQSGKKFDQIIIHSLNPVGSVMMEEELKDCANEVKRIPFVFLKDMLRK
jgi:CheY-like chemotaxis protein